MSDESLMQPGRINSLLYRMFHDMFEEIAHYTKYSRYSKFPFPKVKALTYQALTHAVDYPEALRIYNEEKGQLNRKYRNETGNMTPMEALERVQSLLDLYKRIGTFRLMARRQVNVDDEPDDMEFACFEYDTTGISDTEPLVQALTEFYYDELKKEYKDRPDVIRRREAKHRAKRAYMFFVKYKQYEEANFDARKIEEIFGITKSEQTVMKQWLDELMHDGKPTIVFSSAGSGKSNTGAFVLQLVLVLRPDWVPITNIPFVVSPDIVKFMGDHNEALRDYRIPKIILVDKMSELLEESAKCILRNVIPAPVIDEMDSAIISSQMRGKIGVSLQAYTWVERHLDTQGPLLVYHYYWSIPKDVRIGGLAHKILGVFWYSNYVTRRRKRVVSRPDMWEFNPTRSGMRYFPVALTSLPYHNKGWSSYHIDVDMQWVNQKIGNATQREAARRILEMMPKREWEKEEKKDPKKREKDAK